MRPRDVERVLVERIAEIIHLRPDEIDAELPHASYGLDSATALVLATELEEELGVPVESSLLWDHLTIRDIAIHLARRIASRSEGDEDEDERDDEGGAR